MNNISLGKTAPLLLVMGSHSQNPKTTKLKCLEQLLMIRETFARKGFCENGNNVGLWLVLRPYVWGECFDFRLDDFASGRVRFCFGFREILLLWVFKLVLKQRLSASSSQALCWHWSTGGSSNNCVAVALVLLAPCRAELGRDVLADLTDVL